MAGAAEIDPGQFSAPSVLVTSRYLTSRYLHVAGQAEG